MLNLYMRRTDSVVALLMVYSVNSGLTTRYVHRYVRAAAAFSQ